MKLNMKIFDTMKTGHKLFSILAAAILLAACTDKAGPVKTPADGDIGIVETPSEKPSEDNQKPDSPQEPELPEEKPVSKSITFDAELVLPLASVDIADGDAAMYWKEGDRITLYCPQADAAKTEYLVLEDVPDQSVSLQLATATMKWGESPTHDFYAVYPSVKIASDLSVNLSMPSFQNTTGPGSPDVSCAKMLAVAEGVTGTPDMVSLKFCPAFTALNIRFVLSDDVALSRIVISSTDGTPVAGNYRAMPDGSQWMYQPSLDAVELTSVMALQTGGTEGVALAAGDQTGFLAFLLPVEYEGFDISLLTSDGKVFRYSAAGGYAPSRVHTVDLGTLPESSSWDTVYGSWMSYIPDNVLVSDLSIPGSHDAATSSVFLGAGKCQGLTISGQLAGGVRLFDLRPDGSDLMIKHGPLSTGVTLSQAMETMKAFLDENPTEGCIAFIKEENTWTGGNVSPALAGFADNIVNYTARLTVGQLRGKILVVARTNYPGTIYGGNFSKGWPDNTTGASLGIGYAQSTATEKFWLQDQYDSSTSTDVKLSSFKSYADKARTSKLSNEWLCNHISLASSLLGSVKNLAKDLNPKAASYLTSNPGRTAIVMMDYCCDSSAGGDALVNAVINQNVRYVQGTR